MTPLIKTILEVVMMLLNMMMLVVLASAVVSWVGADPNNQIVMMLRSITEPMYRPFRKLTRNIPGPFDWAPLAVALAIMTMQVLLKNVVQHMIQSSGPVMPD